MKATDIIRIAEENTRHGSIDEGMERAYLCTLQAVVQTMQECGVTIDPIEDPDKEIVTRCYRNFGGYLVVSISMGSREEQEKCHTPYIVQVKRHNSDRWETHIDTVLENNMTDCDSLCVAPSDDEEDIIYDIRIRRAVPHLWERIQADKKFREDIKWEHRKEHSEFCADKCPLMKDGMCGDSCKAFWDYHLNKLYERMRAKEAGQ